MLKEKNDAARENDRLIENVRKEGKCLLILVISKRA
jgi:hypothetical protein